MSTTIQLSDSKMKRCPKCKIYKPLSEFYKLRCSADGLSAHCKPCHTEYDRTPSAKARKDTYHRVNKARLREYARKHNALPEIKAARARRERHIRETMTPEQRRASAAAQRKYRRTFKVQMIEAYGGKCACCGEDTFEFLTLDHKNGDGSARRRMGEPVGRRLFCRLKRQGWPTDNWQLLCMNCNFALGVYGYCPHQNPEWKDAWRDGESRRARQSLAASLRLTETDGHTITA